MLRTGILVVLLPGRALKPYSHAGAGEDVRHRPYLREPHCALSKSSYRINRLAEKINSGGYGLGLTESPRE